MKSKFLVLMMFLAISCKSPDKDLYKFDPRDLKENKITLSEIADDITYVPLDNNYPLGLIYENIVFINNSIYLSAKDVGILVFNKEGKALREIGSIGRGPGEYVYNFKFTVDEKTETVYIWDIGDIIKVYSKTGDFLRGFSLNEYGNRVNELKSYNSKLFVSYQLQNEDNIYKWIIIDSLGNLIKKEERKTHTFISSVGGGSGTYLYQNRLSYFNGYFDDTIYSVLPDLSEIPSFIISPGEHRYPKSRKIYPSELYKYLSLKNIIETAHFLMIQYIYNENRNIVLVNKETRNSFLTNWEFDGSGGIINDLDEGTSFLPKSYFTENGHEYLYGLINPYQIKAQVKSNEFKNFVPKYPEKKKELERLANRLKETDNPIIMIVRLKK